MFNHKNYKKKKKKKVLLLRLNEDKLGAVLNIYYCTVLSSPFSCIAFSFSCWVKIMIARWYFAVVHYRAWSEKTQHKFEDTWQEQRPTEMVLGKGIFLMEILSFEFCCFLLINRTCGISFNCVLCSTRLVIVI